MVGNPSQGPNQSFSDDFLTHFSHLPPTRLTGIMNLNGKDRFQRITQHQIVERLEIESDKY